MSSKVSFCKRATGSGLQILFEIRCSVFVREFDRGEHSPGRVLGCVMGVAGVQREPPSDITSQADVRSVGMCDAFKDVDEGLRGVHVSRLCKQCAAKPWRSSIVCSLSGRPPSHPWRLGGTDFAGK